MSYTMYVDGTVYASSRRLEWLKRESVFFKRDKVFILPHGKD